MTMIVSVECPSCETAFPVDPEKVPEGGARTECTVCASPFRVDPSSWTDGEAEAPWAPPETDGEVFAGESTASDDWVDQGLAGVTGEAWAAEGTESSLESEADSDGPVDALSDLAHLDLVDSAGEADGVEPDAASAGATAFDATEFEATELETVEFDATEMETVEFDAAEVEATESSTPSYEGPVIDVEGDDVGMLEIEVADSGIVDVEVVESEMVEVEMVESPALDAGVVESAGLDPDPGAEDLPHSGELVTDPWSELMDGEADGGAEISSEWSDEEKDAWMVEMDEPGGFGMGEIEVERLDTVEEHVRAAQEDPGLTPPAEGVDANTVPSPDAGGFDDFLAGGETVLPADALEEDGSGLDLQGGAGPVWRSSCPIPGPDPGPRPSRR